MRARLPILLYAAAALALILLGWNKPLFAPPIVHAKPALWVVRDGDTTVYLFGGLREYAPDYRWFEGKVRERFDASDTLIFEAEEAGAAQLEQARHKLVRRTATLSQRLPPETMKRLRVEVQALGVAPFIVDRVQPWRAAYIMERQAPKNVYFFPQFGVGPTLAYEARQQHKRVMTLESPLGQINSYAQLSPQAEELLLARIVDSYPNAKANGTAQTIAWSRGDFELTARLLNADKAASPELAEALILGRNRRWSDWVMRRMAAPGTVFLTVGAGHMGGPGSLLDELRARGLRVERLQ